QYPVTNVYGQPTNGYNTPFQTNTFPTAFGTVPTFGYQPWNTTNGYANAYGVNNTIPFGTPITPNYANFTNTTPWFNTTNGSPFGISDPMFLQSFEGDPSY